MIKRNKLGRFIKGSVDERNVGEKCRWWKGDNIGYRAIHDWLIKDYGMATRCENLNCEGLSNTFQWSLLRDKKCERKRENFWMLCRSCHAKYDFTEETRKKLSDSHKGQVPWNKV